MQNQNISNSVFSKQKIGLILGPLIAIIILFLDLDPNNVLVARTAAIAVLMSIWWITEAIPIPATALLPVALFPLFGIMNGKAVAATYFNHIIFLFIGGFIMALAMQRWNLHRRIALRIILLIGSGPKRILLGFMAATAFLSMWISNTATTMMMVPIAMAVMFQLKEIETSPSIKRFGTGLMIGIAYAASIGGIATLIGTPPNLSFTRIFAIYFPNAPEITFADWFIFGFPLSVIFLLIAWMLLILFFVKSDEIKLTGMDIFKKEYKQLGKMIYEEKIVFILFVFMALLWIFRKNIDVAFFVIPGWSTFFSASNFIDDGTIAIVVALILFIIPSKSQKNERLMDWETASKLQWGIVILFGGGFALATGFKESGLSVWIAGQLAVLSGISDVGLVTSTCTLMTFLTELTSNTATIEMMLPLMSSLAEAIRINPLFLMIPATLSASFAFMLPVATPPNAIVFGSGEVKIVDMVKVGLILNLIGIILVTAYFFLIGVHLFNIDPSILPSWVI